ncbi:hypothetical protein CPB84DRAFT_1912674 [Gymnopilus junonius]|uniref:Uncharacterized protein n=1 Tax=Gymnopilus junonius TaxID=109634 RepID=A0A9P5NWH6_GYMJU|nr:hypothetical protein CPB84DRAFT_1912674 [Gymnopilus junonius]
MSHSSPASYLVWTIMAAILGVFLIFHLWSFDRFKCLNTSSGAFKRIMTYSYLVTVPLIFVYALGNVIIKYHEGFIYVVGFGVVPKPYQLWAPTARASIFPLMLLFSIGWGFEMVTHLEELCFWLFLVNSGSGQQNWFQSLYFKAWIMGSAVAVIYMPLVTIFTRSDPLKSEAFTFLAGSLGSLSLTLWFTPILWTFPSFLKSLRAEGVDVPTIVRLTKFSELNLIRVVFRFLFTVPLLILGVDGVRPHIHINESMLWTDLLTMIAGFGCCISSGITLVIFFPRSIEGEIAARDAAKERKRTRSYGQTTSQADVESNRQMSSYQNRPASSTGGTYLLTNSPVKQTYSFDGHVEEMVDIPYRPEMQSEPNAWEDEEERDIPAALPQAQFKPVRKKAQNRDIEMSSTSESLTEGNLSVHNMRMSNVNPMIHNFISPIDLYETPGNGSRLTFTRK